MWSSGKPHHLSTIPLKDFHLFKIAELVISFCFKNFSNSAILIRWESFSRMVDHNICPPWELYNFGSLSVEWWTISFVHYENLIISPQPVASNNMRERERELGAKEISTLLTMSSPRVLILTLTIVLVVTVAPKAEATRAFFGMDFVWFFSILVLLIFYISTSTIKYKIDRDNLNMVT